MARSNSRTSRYQGEQRLTAISFAVFMVIGAVFAAAYQSWSTARSGSDDAASAPTMSMHAWLDQSQPSIKDLVGARNTIAAAASHRDIAATGAACQTATTAVVNLRQHLPSPESVLNHALQQAISSYVTGLPYCLSATRNHGEGLQRAAGYISDGDAAMQSALDILGHEPGPEPGQLGVLIV